MQCYNKCKFHCIVFDQYNLLLILVNSIYKTKKTENKTLTILGFYI